MLNLINGGIQHSNIFLHMPLFDEIFYEGYLEGKVRKYKAVREDQSCRFLVLNVIRKDECIIWDAVQDFLKRSVIEAAVKVRGVYVFDLLTVDIHKEINTFNLNELTTVMINHSQKCQPGQQRLVKYSSVYGLLQKMVHEDWGKISLKTSVEVFKDKPVFLDLLVKQLIKNFEFSHDPGILLLNDLSQSPLFDPQDALQQERLHKMIEAQIPKAIEFPPEVYIQDKNGVRELLSQTVI
ncbi:MAG: hypothetical protein H6755_06670 [Candidatus Omnitrophica bacterium]|nr:hypothetical protein [Candidatus Omnitrophota bacterium]MCB9748072.1 hypothetical protein [Candidatus Omnitrophota bacterium]